MTFALDKYRNVPLLPSCLHTKPRSWYVSLLRTRTSRPSGSYPRMHKACVKVIPGIRRIPPKDWSFGITLWHVFDWQSLQTLFFHSQSTGNLDSSHDLCFIKHHIRVPRISWLSCNIRCVHKLQHQGVPGMTGWPPLWPIDGKLEVDHRLEKAAHFIFYCGLWSSRVSLSLG